MAEDGTKILAAPSGLIFGTKWENWENVEEKKFGSPSRSKTNASDVFWFSGFDLFLVTPPIDPRTRDPRARSSLRRDAAGCPEKIGLGRTLKRDPDTPAESELSLSLFL